MKFNYFIDTNKFKQLKTKYFSPIPYFFTFNKEGKVSDLVVISLTHLKQAQNEYEDKIKHELSKVKKHDL